MTSMEVANGQDAGLAWEIACAGEAWINLSRWHQEGFACLLRTGHTSIRESVECLLQKTIVK